MAMLGDCSPREQAFKSRMDSLVRDSAISAGLALGSRLGLLQAIMTLPQPFSVDQLAQATNCRTSFLRPWLLLMTSSDIINVSGDGLFTLPPERYHALQSPYSAVNSSLAFISILFKKNDDLALCFKEDGPPDCGDMSELHNMWANNRDRGLRATIPSVLGQIDGLVQALESGCRVLDVGCFEGHLVYFLADAYPNSTFVGIDPSEDGIEKARSKSPSLAKVSFEVMSALNMPAEWSDTFDYAIGVNSVHHFSDPVKGLQVIYRVLKPGACFSAVEIYVDHDLPRMTHHPGSVFYYSWEVFRAGMHSHSGVFDHDEKDDKGHKDEHTGHAKGHKIAEKCHENSPTDHGNLKDNKEHGDDKGHEKGHRGHSMLSRDSGHGQGHVHGQNHAHGQGHEHQGHSHGEHHHHGPTNFQALIKCFQDGGFKNFKMEGLPKAEYLDHIHLFAKK